MAVRGMHDQARGFVHHEGVLILVDHVDRDVLAQERQRGLRVGHVHDERLARADLVRRLDGGPVDGDAAVAREPLDRAAAELGALREEAIDALPGRVRLQLDALGH